MGHGLFVSAVLNFFSEISSREVYFECPNIQNLSQTQEICCSRPLSSIHLDFIFMSGYRYIRFQYSYLHSAEHESIFWNITADVFCSIKIPRIAFYFPKGLSVEHLKRLNTKQSWKEINGQIKVQCVMPIYSVIWSLNGSTNSKYRYI